VEIVNRNAEWSSTVVPLGGTLTFTCTVRHIGLVPIRTKGRSRHHLFEPLEL
jgi:hypothetical protein